MSVMRTFLTSVAVAAQVHLKALGPRARARRTIADRHLRGSGLEIGALHNPLRTSADVRYVDRFSKADLRRHYPELSALPVVEPDIIDDGETLTSVPDGSQDFIIANHFIEHCEDPVGTLATLTRRLRPGGILYMAVPDKRYTFDRARPSTTWEHLELDHADGGVASRREHYEEFAGMVTLGGKGTVEAVRAKADEQEAVRHSIHFHVWTTDEFVDFLGRVRRAAVPDLDLVEAVRNGDETIFVLRRS